MQAPAGGVLWTHSDVEQADADCGTAASRVPDGAIYMPA